MKRINTIISSTRFKFIFWNLLFIFIIGTIRFKFYDFEGEESFLLFLPFVINGIFIVLFGLLLGILAREVYPKKSTKNLIKFIWPFFLYAILGSEFQLLHLFEGFLLFFLFTESPLILIFIILDKLFWGFVFIILPSRWIYNSKWNFGRIAEFLDKNVKLVVILFFIGILFLFVPFLFSINPFCASQESYFNEVTGAACYTPIAALTLNESYCYGTDNYPYDSCLKVVARLKNDPAVCKGVIYKGGLLKKDDHAPRTCLTQFFNKEEGYKACYVFEDYKKSFVDECIDTYMWFQIDYDEDLEYYTRLKDICDNITYPFSSACTTIMGEYEQRAKFPENKEKVLQQIREYKEYLKDEETFMKTVFNPPDTDFCRLLLVFNEEKTIIDDYWFSEFEEGDHYSMVCFVNFGKNNKGTEICDIPVGSFDRMKTDSWEPLCGAGKYFVSEYSDNRLYRMYNSYYTFQLGVGIATYNEELPIPEDWDKKYVQRGVDLVNNLKPVKFCDRIQNYKKECEEIVYSD